MRSLGPLGELLDEILHNVLCLLNENLDEILDDIMGLLDELL